MNDVTTTDNGANPFVSAGAGVSDATFMKFNGNTGEYTYGEDNEEMEHGSQLAAGLEASMWSWTFWWEGKPMEKVEDLLIENPKLCDQEPDWLPEDPDGDIDMSLEEIRKQKNDRNTNFNDGWSLQAILPLVDINDDMAEYSLRLGSKGAIRSFKGLSTTFGKQMRFHPNEKPIVELGASSYQIKGVGKKYSPTLKIVDWVNEDEMMAGDDPSLYEEEQQALPAPDEGEGEEPQAESKEEPKEEAKPRGRSRRTRGSKY